MMKIHLPSTLFLVAVFLAACAPAASPGNPPAAATHQISSVVSATKTPVVSESATQPLPIATSRGPNLEDTDPGTVSLASGGLQFVEFFRFT